MTADTLPQVVELPAGNFALIGQAANWKRMVENYAIDSKEMYEAGATDLRAIKGIRKQLDEERTRLKAPILEAGRAIDGFFKKPIAMLDEAADTVNRAMIGFKREQDRIAREEQAKLEAAAEAERRRLAAEARELAEAGRAEEAAQVQSVAAVMVAPRAAVEAPKAEGVHTRTTYKANVVNLGALVEHIAANYKSDPSLLDYIDPDMTTLNRLAGALRDGLRIPGVEVVAHETVVAR